MLKNSGQFVKGARQKRLARMGGKAFWKDMTLEQRSAFSTKRNLASWAKITLEEKQHRTRNLKKMWENTTPAQRVQILKARMKKIGKKRRSERIAKGWANSAPEQKVVRAMRMRTTKLQNGLKKLIQEITNLREQIGIARVNGTPDGKIIQRYNLLLGQIEPRKAKLSELNRQKIILEKALRDQKKQQP